MSDTHPAEREEPKLSEQVRQQIAERLQELETDESEAIGEVEIDLSPTVEPLWYIAYKTSR